MAESTPNWREIREECARVCDELKVSAEKTVTTFLEVKEPSWAISLAKATVFRAMADAADDCAQGIRALPAPPGAGGDEDKGALSDRDERSDELVEAVADAIGRATVTSTVTESGRTTVSHTTVRSLLECALADDRFAKFSFLFAYGALEAAGRAAIKVMQGSQVAVLERAANDFADIQFDAPQPWANEALAGERRVRAAIEAVQKVTGGEPRGKATSEHPSAEDGGAG